MTKYLFLALIVSFTVQSCDNNEPAEASAVELSEHDSLHAVHYASDNFEKEQGVEVIQSELDFGKLLIDLESQLGWEHFEDSWKGRRSEWVLDCQNAITTQDKSALLIEFENTIQRKFLRPKWNNLRVNWLDNCKKATSNNELGTYLIELESKIRWGKVSPGWPLNRQGWIRDCQAL